VSGQEQNGGRVKGTRLTILIAASSLPFLVACSSTSSVEYATDAYPSQSLVDLLKESKNSPPPAPSAVPPAPAATVDASVPASAASAPPPAREPPPAAAAAAGSQPPAPSPSAENDDPVAAAFPSVSLIDLLTGRKSGAQ
jgi:hypothetical protein